jgi:mRNA-degrading endonuclease RelE of RelBE toxin-antitoxin system
MIFLKKKERKKERDWSFREFWYKLDTKEEIEEFIKKLKEADVEKIKEEAFTLSWLFACYLLEKVDPNSFEEKYFITEILKDEEIQQKLRKAEVLYQIVEEAIKTACYRGLLPIIEKLREFRLEQGKDLSEKEIEEALSQYIIFERQRGISVVITEEALEFFNRLSSSGQTKIKEQLIKYVVYSDLIKALTVLSGKKIEEMREKIKNYLSSIF